MTHHPLEEILRHLRAALPDPAFAWLEQGLARLAAGPLAQSDVPNELNLLSAIARRRLGTAPLASEPIPVTTHHGTIDIGRWATGDAGRVALLLAAVVAHPSMAAELVSSLFRQGDELERAAVVRALALLPAPERYKPLALEAGRANSLVLISALALSNPYPAACYDEHEFNQMVLKALFLGLPIEAISGLRERANPDLARMCEDYLDEHVAAGRPVPCDLWLALGPHASARGERLMLDYARDPEPRHRYYAALALLQRRPLAPPVREILSARLARETDERVLGVLRTGLAS